MSYCTKKRKHSFSILKALYRPTFVRVFNESVGRKKCFQYAKRMFRLFHAIVKFCSTNRLSKYELSVSLGEVKWQESHIKVIHAKSIFR